MWNQIKLLLLSGCSWTLTPGAAAHTMLIIIIVDDQDEERDAGSDDK